MVKPKVVTCHSVVHDSLTKSKVLTLIAVGGQFEGCVEELVILGVWVVVWVVVWVGM